MQIGPTCQAPHDHQVDVAMVYSTDGRIQESDLKVLADDENYSPSSAMVPVMRKATPDANPQPATLLDKFSTSPDHATMVFLNTAADMKRSWSTPLPPAS